MGEAVRAEHIEARMIAEGVAAHASRLAAVTGRQASGLLETALETPPACRDLEVQAILHQENPEALDFIHAALAATLAGRAWRASIAFGDLRRAALGAPTIAALIEEIRT